MVQEGVGASHALRRELGRRGGHAHGGGPLFRSRFFPAMGGEPCREAV